MNHECLDVEVVEWSGSGTGRSSSSAHWGKRLLVEAEYAELVDDEVQTPEEEGLECHEDERSPHPSKWERGKLQRQSICSVCSSLSAVDRV